VPETPVSNFRLPPELKAAVQAVAADRGETLTDAVIEGLTLYLRKHSPTRSRSPRGHSGA